MPLMWNSKKPDHLGYAYAVGDDTVWETRLLGADILATHAHAQALKKHGILTTTELKKLKNALKQLYKQWEKGKLAVTLENEDAATCVEQALIHKLGDTGKKIHAGRSRNDLLRTEAQLYTKQHLFYVMQGTLEAATSLYGFAKKYEKVGMPGYTHYQKAMPSSVGQWAGAHAWALLEASKHVQYAYNANNASPLGAAAGYGSPLKLDYKATAQALGFSTAYANPLHAINARAPLAAVTLGALLQAQGALSKLASDLVLYTSPHYGFFTMPKEFTTGSSIMPQKKNPDVAEILRGGEAAVLGGLVQVVTVEHGLPSGFNRDTQLTKKPLIEGLDSVQAGLGVATPMMKALKVNKQACAKALTPEVYAAHTATALAQQGMPFRDAYMKVKKGKVPFIQKAAVPGAGLAGWKQTLAEQKQWLRKEKSRQAKTWSAVKQ